MGLAPRFSIRWHTIDATGYLVLLENLLELVWNLPLVLLGHLDFGSNKIQLEQKQRNSFEI